RPAGGGRGLWLVVRRRERAAGVPLEPGIGRAAPGAGPPRRIRGDRLPDGVPGAPAGLPPRRATRRRAGGSDSVLTAPVLAAGPISREEPTPPRAVLVAGRRPSDVRRIR